MFDGPKTQLLKTIFDRFMSWRLGEFVAPAYPVILEYPIDPTPRYGYGKPPHASLKALIARGDARYEAHLKSLLAYGEALSAIAQRPNDGTAAPTFTNTYFSGLDAVDLYAILAQRNPATLLEIGSGFSTRFARRSIEDNRLRTKIVSCDPEPRADIASISDRIIREPFEQLDLSVLDTLGENDILFIDSSHRCFTNSDVTVQFLDAIPRLKPGVLIHIHDILLPYDYPPAWSPRHYSEQYLLACYLLGGGGNCEIVCPHAYISTHERLAEILDPLWRMPGMDAVLRHTKPLYEGYLGFSFWMRAGGPRG
jgi:hypothetical protein